MGFLLNKKKLLGVFTALFFASLLVFDLFILARSDFSARENEGRRRFGAIYMTLNNPFYEIVDEEIRTAVENRGDVLISRDPALSAARQQEEFSELIREGCEVIFLNPVDWRETGEMLEMARKAGVIVIAIDTEAQGAGVAATIVSDNYQAGVQCAKHLLGTRQGGNIALLLHSEARSAQDRIQGFLDTLAPYPDFKVVARAECLGQLERAMPAMEEMLGEHGEIDTVMALNDPAAMGALAALRQAGRLEGVAVYGVDGVPETKEMIARGFMQATAGQSPRQIGRLAAQTAYRLLSGEETAPLVKLPTRLITRENVASSNQDGWD